MKNSSHQELVKNTEPTEVDGDTPVHSRILNQDGKKVAAMSKMECSAHHRSLDDNSGNIST